MDFSAMRLSIAAGLLSVYFEDRHGYEPNAYSVFIGPVEVVLYECFDGDMDILLEAIVGSTVSRASLLRLRASLRPIAAAA
jgi:hypothetical protein